MIKTYLFSASKEKAVKNNQISSSPHTEKRPCEDKVKITPRWKMVNEFAMVSETLLTPFIVVNKSSTQKQTILVLYNMTSLIKV